MHKHEQYQWICRVHVFGYTENARNREYKPLNAKNAQNVNGFGVYPLLDTLESQETQNAKVQKRQQYRRMCRVPVLGTLKTKHVSEYIWAAA
jgi:hypothetical protein